MIYFIVLVTHFGVAQRIYIFNDVQAACEVVKYSRADIRQFIPPNTTLEIMECFESDGKWAVKEKRY